MKEKWRDNGGIVWILNSIKSTTVKFMHGTEIFWSYSSSIFEGIKTIRFACVRWCNNRIKHAKSLIIRCFMIQRSVIWKYTLHEYSHRCYTGFFFLILLFFFLFFNVCARVTDLIWHYCSPGACVSTCICKSFDSFSPHGEKNWFSIEGWPELACGQLLLYYYNSYI